MLILDGASRAPCIRVRSMQRQARHHHHPVLGMILRSRKVVLLLGNQIRLLQRNPRINIGSGSPLQGNISTRSGSWLRSYSFGLLLYFGLVGACLVYHSLPFSKLIPTHSQIHRNSFNPGFPPVTHWFIGWYLLDTTSDRWLGFYHQRASFLHLPLFSALIL